MGTALRGLSGVDISLYNFNVFTCTECALNVWGFLCEKQARVSLCDAGPSFLSKGNIYRYAMPRAVSGELRSPCSEQNYTSSTLLSLVWRPRFCAICLQRLDRKKMENAAEVWNKKGRPHDLHNTMGQESALAHLDVKFGACFLNAMRWLHLSASHHIKVDQTFLHVLQKSEANCSTAQASQDAGAEIWHHYGYGLSPWAVQVYWV